MFLFQIYFTIDGLRSYHPFKEIYVTIDGLVSLFGLAKNGMCAMASASFTYFWKSAATPLGINANVTISSNEINISNPKKIRKENLKRHAKVSWYRRDYCLIYQ